jgi:hypothetical protein
MLRKIIKNYEAPTPAKWRKIGDALLVVGATITSYLLNYENHTLAKIALACTILGKVITNLAAEPEKEPS